MSDWMIGARYACPTCLVRGWTIMCPKCRAPRADIAQDEGLSRLASEWPHSRAWREGRSIFSPRAIPQARTVLLCALVLAILGWIGSTTLAYSNMRDMGDAIGTLVVGLLFLPVTLAIYALTVFYFAHALRLLAFVMYLLGAIFAGFEMLGALLESISKRLLPRMEYDVIREPKEVRGTITLLEPMRVHRLVDELGWVTRYDAHIPPVRVALDGRELSLEMGAGKAALSAWKGERSPELNASESSGYRDAATSEMPRHMEGYGRGVSSTKVFAEGTQLIVRGGVIDQGVLRGTREAPIWLSLFESR